MEGEAFAISVEIKNNLEAKATEGNFGTVGAIATAFVYGFLPQRAVLIKKSVDNSGRKSKHSPQLRSMPDR
jgi:hypothetical protein